MTGCRSWFCMLAKPRSMQRRTPRRAPASASMAVSQVNDLGMSLTVFAGMFAPLAATVGFNVAPSITKSYSPFYVGSKARTTVCH